MNLIEAYTTACVRMIKTTGADGEGGTNTSYTEGEEFNAAITLDSSTEAKIAESQGVTNLYTITTTKDVTFSYHEVIKRKSDGLILRITSDGTDKTTPAPATLNMRQVSAEKWVTT